MFRSVCTLVSEYISVYACVIMRVARRAANAYVHAISRSACAHVQSNQHLSWLMLRTSCPQHYASYDLCVIIPSLRCVR